MGQRPACALLAALPAALPTSAADGTVGIGRIEYSSKLLIGVPRFADVSAQAMRDMS
jgi:hypothetical protein